MSLPDGHLQSPLHPRGAVTSSAAVANEYHSPRPNAAVDHSAMQIDRTRSVGKRGCKRDLSPDGQKGQEKKHKTTTHDSSIATAAVAADASASSSSELPPSLVTPIPDRDSAPSSYDAAALTKSHQVALNRLIATHRVELASMSDSLKSSQDQVRRLESRLAESRAIALRGLLLSQSLENTTPWLAPPHEVRHTNSTSNSACQIPLSLQLSQVEAATSAATTTASITTSARVTTGTVASTSGAAAAEEGDGGGGGAAVVKAPRSVRSFSHHNLHSSRPASSVDATMIAATLAHASTRSTSATQFSRGRVGGSSSAASSAAASSGAAAAASVRHPTIAASSDIISFKGTTTLYEVDHISNKRQNHLNRSTEYFVHWVGYSPEEASWEPATNLRTSARQAINRFEASRKKV